MSPEEIVAAIEGRARRVDTPCGDGTMAWRIWGEGNDTAPPLVLSHGAQGAWSHWIRNVEVLAKRRMVIAADMPGHGDSALPDTPDHKAISRAISVGLAEIIGNDIKVDLAGFSFGGIAFAHFAAFHPAQVRRLVLVGTGGLGTPHGHINIQRVRGLEGDARKAMLRSNLLGLMLHGEPAADELAMHLQVTNGRKATLANAGDLVVPDKLVRILPEVAAQVDAIWGAFDRPHPDPELQASVVRRSHPDCDLHVIPDAGHWCMYENADAFNAALLALLRQPLRD
jgi:pimeloyl-ACP methyl ester carboxylesterase